MKKLKVSDYMTRNPHSIGPAQKLAVAHRLMREHRIRHLPVLDDGRVVGIVSVGDLHLVETLKDVDPEKVVVEEAMSQDVYTVPPDAPLAEVAAVMAERKLGCVIVVERDKAVGVFTTVDALRALAERG